MYFSGLHSGDQEMQTSHAHWLRYKLPLGRRYKTTPGGAHRIAGDGRAGV